MPKSLRPRLQDNPRFGEFMALFDRMRVEGAVNYQALYRSINALDPSVPYMTVYKVFKKLGDPFVIAKRVARHELREKMKKIADVGLDEVALDPTKLSMRDRIGLGKLAAQEELAEIKIILEEKHKQKKDSLIDALLDDARYGSVEGQTIPQLDKSTQDLALPDPTTGSEPSGQS